MLELRALAAESRAANYRTIPFGDDQKTKIDGVGTLESCWVEKITFEFENGGENLKIEVFLKLDP